MPGVSGADRTSAGWHMRRGKARGSSLKVDGDETLYKVVALREYVDGVIVEAGEETGEGTLEPTWDWVRAHE